MVEIIIKRKIVTERIAATLKKIAVCAPEGSCIPIALPNGDFTFNVPEDIKTYWDSSKVVTNADPKPLVTYFILL